MKYSVALSFLMGFWHGFILEKTRAFVFPYTIYYILKRIFVGIPTVSEKSKVSKKNKNNLAII